MIKAQRLKYPVPLMCHIFKVSPSGYYQWCNRSNSEGSKKEARLEAEIIAAHKRTRETFGPERLQHDLAAHGVKISIYKIKRIRKKLGLRCKQKKKFKATTNSNHKLPVAKNLLDQKFETTAPKQVWLTDLTYIHTQEGWLYLAGHKDIFTGEIVGYAMGARMTKALVSQSLFRAVVSKHPSKGLIHHSDRGSQYCSYSYRKLLTQFGMVSSMSRRGNCYDNAPMESFWGTLKQELVHHRKYRSRQEAINDITEYIEIFYNRQRRQERLGYLSPAAFEQHFYRKLHAA